MPNTPAQTRHRPPARAWAGLLLTLSLLLASGAALAQSGEAYVVKRNTDMRQNVADDKTITPLSANTELTRLAERQGAWVKVKLQDGKTGWVHMFALQRAGAAASTASGGSTGLLRMLGQSLSAGGTPTTTRTATVGVRGLDAGDLGQSGPNVAAVTEAEKLRVDEALARQFAKQVKLTSRDVAELPNP